jgi:hypothetical protein
MNERIKEIWSQAGGNYDGGNQHTWPQYTIDNPEKFAELIVKECKENFAKVWYEQGLDIRGAEIGKFLTRFEEHFGVEE